jgi:hypothetical protein
MHGSAEGRKEMKKAEREARVVELWEGYREALKDRQEAERKVKEAKEVEESYKGELIGLVPEGGEVAGVQHTTYEKRSVRYSKLFNAVVNGYVPKTKRAEAEGLKEEFTTGKVVHTLKGE